MPAPKFRCITESCLERTGHGSGFCQVCRSRSCVECGISFVIIRRAEMRRERCSEHQQNFVKAQRRSADYTKRQTA